MCTPRRPPGTSRTCCSPRWRRRTVDHGSEVMSEWSAAAIDQMANAAFAEDAEALWRQAHAWSLAGQLLHAHADRLTAWRDSLAGRWQGAAAIGFLAEIDRLVAVVRTSA